MKLHRILILATAAWSFAAGAAQPSLESVEELLTLSRAESMVDSMNAGMEGVMRSALAETIEREKLSAKQQRVLEQFPARFAQVVRDEMTWASMKPELIDIYRSVYTQQEIDGQLDFYRSPAGQAMLEKMPQVMQKSMEMSERQMRRLMPKLQAALEEATAQAKATQ